MALNLQSSNFTGLGIFDQNSNQLNFHVFFSQEKMAHNPCSSHRSFVFCIRYFMGCSKENGYSIPRRKEKDYWLVVREKTHCSKSDSFVHKYISTQKSRGKSSKNPRKIRGKKKSEKKNPQKSRGKIIKKSGFSICKKPFRTKNYLGKNYQKIRIFNLEKTFSDKKLKMWDNV